MHTNLPIAVNKANGQWFENMEIAISVLDVHLLGRHIIPV
jgi:hypothetical protein